MRKFLTAPVLMLTLAVGLAAASLMGLHVPAEVALGLSGMAGIVQTAAGTTLRISASQPATFDSAGYDTLFTSSPGWGSVVGEITNYGEFGRDYALINHNPVGSRGTQKFKGSFNEGQIPLQLALDSDDAGQIKMKTARDSDNNYSFCIETPEGDKFYFQAKVMTFKTNIGGVDNVITASSNLEITTNAAGVGVVESLAV